MDTAKKAWFELMRLSNLPTVLSGAFVVSLGGAFRTVSLVDLLMLLIAMACFYAAGFIFNDVFDRHIDADERPHRPIPSGRIRTHSAVQVGVLLLAAGLMLVAAVDQIFHGPEAPRGIPGGLFAAVLLVILMLLYNRFHAISAWAVFLMAACRVLVYVTCILVALDTAEQYEAFLDYFFTVTVSGPLIWYLLAIFLYVAGFSRIARGEAVSRSGSRYYCYHCGHGADSRELDQCPECGRSLEHDKLARSTRPPINRVIEWLSLAATFTPIIVLTLFFIMLRATRFAMQSVTPEYPITTSEYVWGFIFGALIVFVACWVVFATVLYCKDRTNPRKSILMWIAGIPLIDGLLAIELGLPFWALAICFGLFLVTIWGHRRIAGT